MWKYGQILAMIITLLAMPAAGASTTKKAAPIGAEIYTSYSLNGMTGLWWSTCGSLPESQGCYGTGFMAIDKICGMLQGPSTKDDVVTQELYTLGRGPTTAPEATFEVWTKAETITSSTVRTTVDHNKTLVLPLDSSASVACAMAANAQFIFIGMSSGKTIVKIDRASLTYETIANSALPAPVSRIMANEDGYVVVTFGSGASAKSSLYGPDGTLTKEIDGDPIILNSATGLNPK